MKIYYLMAVFCLSKFLCLSQIEKMNNGGFENYSYNSSCATDDYFICHATDWKMLNNTPDVIHSSNSQGTSASHFPRTLNGNARFASPPNGMDEYFYGTTLSLNSGQTYVVSFWVRKDYSTTKNIPVGLHIGSNLPGAQILNPYVQTIVPQITLTPTGTNYIRGSYCFTASQTGIHYITIGTFTGNGTGEGQVFLVDDVSVKELEGTEGTATSNISISGTEFCVGDNISINGTSSTNENQYEWDLYETTSGHQVIVYDSPVINGEAGYFDLPAAIGNVSPGDCFRLYLKAYNGCPAVSSVDFCYDNPTFNFISDDNSVCVNTPVELEVSGDNGWTYVWKQNGVEIANEVGRKTFTVTPTSAGTVQYTVTVITGNGCAATKTFNLLVQSLATQIAPSMNGIDNTGEYTVYVNAGGIIDFTGTIFNNSGEIVSATISSNLPPGYQVNLPPYNSNGGTFQFYWHTNLLSTGNYYLTFNLTDNNRCQQLSSTYTFNIVVICDYCPMCEYLNNRTPSNNPLPSDVYAAKCITVGELAPVQIAQGAHVDFRAGDYVLIGDHFDTESGTSDIYIDKTICTSGCQDCCVGWDGFTYDNLPNIITPNGNGLFDVWNITDMQHPHCAYGAVGFDLYILDRWGVVVYQVNSRGGRCCPYQSTMVEVYPDINWDGKTNVGINAGTLVTDGVYYFSLYLHGCGETALLSGNITKLDIEWNTGMSQSEPEVIENAGNIRHEFPAAMPEIHDAGASTEQERLVVYPNPSAGTVKVYANKAIENISVLDENGKLLLEQREDVIDISMLSSGKYTIRILFTDKQQRQQRLIKQ